MQLILMAKQRLENFEDVVWITWFEALRCVCCYPKNLAQPTTRSRGQQQQDIDEPSTHEYVMVNRQTHESDAMPIKISV